jgi:hypothetical protein
VTLAEVERAARISRQGAKGRQARQGIIGLVGTEDFFRSHPALGELGVSWRLGEKNKSR